MKKDSMSTFYNHLNIKPPNYIKKHLELKF